MTMVGLGLGTAEVTVPATPMKQARMVESSVKGRVVCLENLKLTA
jgi:hypothetical protein